MYFILFRQGEREESQSVSVYTKDGSPPDINITPLVGKHDPSKPLIISATITSPLAFQANWETVSGEGKFTPFIFTFINYLKYIHVSYQIA